MLDWNTVAGVYVVRLTLVSSGIGQAFRVDVTPSTTGSTSSRRSRDPGRCRAIGATEVRNRRVIDATCPLVTNVHLEVVRFAKSHRTIVLIGHRDHDEVIGMVGEAPDQTIVVSIPYEAETVQVPDGDVAYLTQTTLSLDEAQSIIYVLKRRFAKIQGPPAMDICYATENRQVAIKHIASKADVLLVVGSRNSSNSTRMAEVGSQHSLTGYLIDDEEDFESAWLGTARTVAVSAGASATECLVKRVLYRLAGLGFRNMTEV